MSDPNLNALAPIISRSGANFALADPILKLRDGAKKTNSKLHDAIKLLYNAKRKENESTWNQVWGLAQLNALFCKGEFMLQRNPRTFGYYPRRLAENEFRQQPPNLIRVYRHVCASKIMSTNPNVRISAGDDDPRSISSAQLVRPMVDYWESQFYKARFNWRVANDKLNNGTSIIRVRWNPWAEGPSANRMDTGEQESGDEGFGECMDCPHQGPAEDFQNEELSYGGQCPKCGSNAVEVSPGQKQLLSKVSQGAPQNIGAPEINRESLFACQWDAAKDMEESTWAIIRHRTTPGMIKLLLGDAILPDSPSSDDRGLEILKSLAYFGIDSGTNRQNDKSPTLAEFWISREEMADIQIEGGKTVSGHDLPAGRMSDVFKQPVCIVGLNDMSLQIGIYYEQHRDQIVTGQWQVEADSGLGWGINDLTHTQKRLNRWDGHVDKGLAATATPTVLIDPRYLADPDDESYLFKPGKTVKLNLSQLPLGSKPENVMYVAQPGAVNAQYLAQGKHLMDMIQLQSFALEFSDQIAGLDSNTATGSQIVSHLAGSLYGPVSEVIGEERVRIAEILVDLNRKHDPVGRYYPNANGARGRVVSGKDIQGSLVFELMEDSQVPVTPITKKADQVAFIQGVGGIQALAEGMQSIPKIMNRMAKTAGVVLEDEDPDVVSSICLDRLQQMEDKLSAGVTDPRELVASIRPQPSVIEPKHAEKRDWWSNFLDSREGLEAPAPIRAAAEGMYALHLQLESQKSNPEAIAKGWTQGLAAAATQAPAALGMQALQGGGQMGQPDQAAQQQHEQQQQSGQQQHEAEQAAAQRQQELQQQQNDHDHEAALKTMEINAENQRSAAQQTPSTKIAESLTYSDLPPAAQAAMLKEVGLPSSGTKEVHAATLAKAKASTARTATR